MTWSLRLVVAALLSAFLGWSAVVPSDAVAKPSSAPTIYAYDVQHQTVGRTYTTPERSPPGIHGDSTAYDAGDYWWRGASTRTNELVAPATYDYDVLDRFVQTTRGSNPAEEPVGGADLGSAVIRRFDVAANTGTPTGPARDALGRFTSGAGGESAATAAGRSAHANYANTLGGGNYVFNRALPGSRLRPDAVDFSQNIVRELKPGTPSAISRGWRQVNEYKAYLEELTGQPWTAYVDEYTP